MYLQGSERSVVEMSIDNFDVWRPLQQVKSKDPEILRIAPAEPNFAEAG